MKGVTMLGQVDHMTMDEVMNVTVRMTIKMTQVTVDRLYD